MADRLFEVRITRIARDVGFEPRNDIEEDSCMLAKFAAPIGVN
jgi:hypothetical protein